jgi:putative N-acetylmannosamine-6-phosphate epimerase
VIIIYCKIDGKDIPLVTTGTSPFIGAGQFGFKAYEWHRKFLNNSDAMVEILKASYQAGARGIEAIPIGKIMEASRIMTETHDNYIVIGSTSPMRSRGSIKDLIEGGAKLIFVHGIVSDCKGKNLLQLLNEISSQGIIPGIATHDPVSTLKYCFENSLNVKAFLIPFNAKGYMMGNVEELESIVDNKDGYWFVGMKTLAAGRLSPSEAFEYISKHNICSVTIGMVSTEEAEITTKIALNALSK